MPTRSHLRSTITLLLTLLFFIATNSQETHATTDDAWWNNNWPYRISIEVSQDGPVAANLNFSELFDNLGLNQALLDLRSIRVIPYKDGKPGSPVPFQETYSTLIIDADSLGDDTSGHWIPEESISDIRIDSERFTQGIGSLYLHARILDSSLSENGFSFQFNSSSLGDWSKYETLLYDVCSEVNNEAIDQTPDLYSFELYGLTNCPIYEIKGPGLAINRWNGVSVSLKPYGSCLSPNLSDIEAMKFQLKVNMPWDNGGYFDPGDEVDFWMDNFRLVDQDGDGQIIWNAMDEFDKYYIYFDTLNHEGHPKPAMDVFDEPILTSSLGEPEAGGYFHKIDGVSDNQITVWNAPPTEKIIQTYKTPIASQPLEIHAAKGEFEPIQLVINSPSEQTLPISVGNLFHDNGRNIIDASYFDIFRVDFVEISTLSDQYSRLGYFPDPLFPINNHQSVTFKTGLNQPLWFRIKVPLDATPGTYHGEIIIGKTNIPIKLIVWNFELPEGLIFNSKFGFNLDQAIEAYQAGACQEAFKASVDETFHDYRISPSFSENPEIPDEVLLYTLSSYEVVSAHDLQIELGKKVWWEFTYTDTPPFANPGVIDRTGVESRILPVLAWLDRVDGLVYLKTNDWDIDPWTQAFSNGASNGDGYLFYPPNEPFQPCTPEGTRLIPSIRLELLREGLEDYAYLWLLNKGNPAIGIENKSDSLASGIIQSDTLFSHNPTSFYDIRDKIALLLESEVIDSNIYFFLPYVCH
ncbi:MAG: Uncharacterized protein XD73_1037 [Anaerolinea thermophila]|uniref:Glycoside hydrolase 123 catalytic domain-containing protein n=1 Tax=Anaerolinea thermophila TaxID=167964 RepID=A0A101FX42_9CHLR|nr:MAG: Uncharacterized protein XD73_1037 [Anaerolinea thermophila]